MTFNLGGSSQVKQYSLLPCALTHLHYTWHKLVHSSHCLLCVAQSTLCTLCTVAAGTLRLPESEAASGWDLSLWWSQAPPSSSTSAHS